MSVSLSAGIIATTASVVIAQAPVLALEESGGILWGLSAGEIIATASVFIAFFSAGIAVIALQVSIRESRRMEKHNQLSVKPLLNIGATKSFEGQTNDVLFELSNVGIGPAFIKRYVMFIDGTEYVIDSPLAAERFKAQMLKRGFEVLRLMALDPKKSIIGAGEKNEMLGGNFIGEVSFNLDVVIEHESIYGNKRFVYKHPDLIQDVKKQKQPTKENQKG